MDLRMCRPLLPLLCLWLAFGRPAHASCAARTRTADLQRPINEAQAAFASMDGTGFARAGERGAEALRCLSEPISPTMAAAWHRHEGLAAFLADDAARARSAFRAARALQPSWALPEDVAPPGNPLTQLYEEAGALGPGPEEPVSVQPGLTLLVDGALSGAVPTERPAIVQVLAADGQVLHTDYLRVGAPLPADLAEAAAAPKLAAVAPPPPHDITIVTQRERPPVALLASAGGALLLSGGAYAWSASLRDRYLHDETVADEDLPGLITRNHAAVVTAGALAAAGLGLGVSAVVVW